MPIFLGYIPIGAAFGIVATSIGFSTLQAVICSATALAGAGQFIALAQMRAGESLLAVLAATTVVNLRYVLFATTLSPHLRRLSLPKQAALAFTLTDESFAVNINDRQSGLSTASSMAGVGVIAWSGWVIGTGIGASMGDLIGDPSRWGVEFAMPAMFSALFVALAQNYRHLIIGGISGVLAIGMPALSFVGIQVPSALTIIVSSIAAATIGAFLYPNEKWQ